MNRRHTDRDWTVVLKSYLPNAIVACWLGVLLYVEFNG